jgi:hypothetical protein
LCYVALGAPAARMCLIASVAAVCRILTRNLVYVLAPACTIRVLIFARERSIACVSACLPAQLFRLHVALHGCSDLHARRVVCCIMGKFGLYEKVVAKKKVGKTVVKPPAEDETDEELSNSAHPRAEHAWESRPLSCQNEKSKIE